MQAIRLRFPAIGGWLRGRLDGLVRMRATAAPRGAGGVIERSHDGRSRHAARTAMSREAFPQTLNPTWWDARLNVGDEASLTEARNHIMLVYSDPLKAYFTGSSFREMGDADEIVHGFFADRLSRPDYLRQWRASGKRLRRWLMNGLCFYLRECIRDENLRDATGTHALVELASADPTESRAMDVAFLQSVVQHALASSRADCAARNLQEHWEYFHAYHLLGRSCDDLAAEHGVDHDRMWVMIRTGQRRFAKALRDHLAEDGVRADQIDDEIRDLLELANT